MYYFFIGLEIVAGLAILVVMLAILIVIFFGVIILASCAFERWNAGQRAYIILMRFCLRRPAPRIQPEQAREIARDWMIARGGLDYRFTKSVPADVQRDLLLVHDGPCCWTVVTARSMDCFIVKVDNLAGTVRRFEDLSHLGRHNLFELPATKRWFGDRQG